jgi:hypothetical protein
MGENRIGMVKLLDKWRRAMTRVSPVVGFAAIRARSAEQKGEDK